MRYAAGVEYMGAGFKGWQALGKLRTVQAELQVALSTTAAHPLKVVGAGRTDSGVHACQQVVHFDSDAQRTPYAWLLGTNSWLPPDLSLRWVQPVTDDFHARYGVVRRHYRYLIYNQRARASLWHQRAAWWPQTLDADAMHAAGQCLIGTHDFSAFRDSQCQSKTPIRLIEALTVRRFEHFVVIDVTGKAFLHHMVRNIAGTLAAVGIGKAPPQWVAEVLASKDRTQAGVTARAAGLYFLGPEYPAQFALPAPPQQLFPPV